MDCIITFKIMFKILGTLTLQAFLNEFKNRLTSAGSKLTFSKISAKRKAPENPRRPFKGKNPLKMGNYTIF